MAKYKIYAVAIGVDPNTKEEVHKVICNSWDECKEYIIGVKNAKYKGFLTTQEAEQWCDNVLKEYNTISNETVDKTEEDYGDNEIHIRFSMICKKLGVPSKDIVLMLKKQFISQYKDVTELQKNNSF